MNKERISILPGLLADKPDNPKPLDNETGDGQTMARSIAQIARSEENNAHRVFADIQSIAPGASETTVPSAKKSTVCLNPASLKAWVFGEK
ncbi:hypothetical protein [Parabacteroides merdae]|jgi:hypothetical protein|uniref:hypothetical protein n=1 Tax=Parabacteroides merdae TaxID=46503 RepID=UPI0034A530A7